MGLFGAPNTFILFYYIMKNWEIKNRTYLLKGMTPLSYTVRSKGLLFFDEEKGINREIRYATNQKSLFIDEQDGNARLGHIIFADGALHTTRDQVLLQQLLSIYHPKAGITWEEVDEAKEAEDEVVMIEREIEALELVKSLDIEDLEAIMRTEIGGSVRSMSSKELKRDAYVFAKKNPKLFKELAEDEDIKLRNLANRAVETGILKLTDGNTVFKFKNGKKVMTVPFDQHPYQALAQYFKTDDGVTLMKSIMNKLD